MTATLSDLLDARTTRAFDLSSDGHVLVGNDDSGTVQLYEIAPSGDWAQLTDLGEACSGRYLKGERAVVVQHDAGGTERYQLSLLRLDEQGAELTELVRDDRYIHRLVDVLPGRIVYLTNRRDGVAFDVIIRDLADDRERVLYDGGGWVGDVAVSPDERYVVLDRPGTPANSYQLVLVETATGKLTELTPADEPAIYENPRWAPDSASFTFSTNSEREFLAPARYDVQAGGWSYLDGEDRSDTYSFPAPDGSRELLVRNVDGAHHFILAGERLPLPHDGVLMRALQPVWAPDGSQVAITFASPIEPGDVWVATASGRLHRVTDSSPDLDKEALAFPTSHRVPTPDGNTIPCFLYRGPDCDGSVVVNIHGGPEAQALRTWNPIVQALVAQGQAVLVPNVRGSTGYGKAWYSADDVRKRLDSVADLAALHAWLPATGLDPTRAALYGGSYGGYMVLAGLTMQPDLWAAGVDIVGISSLVTFLQNTSPYRLGHREREYGSLERDYDFLVSASPITHIDQLRAPLLILHGANDPRVPVTEAEQMAAALRERGVECELVVYPDEGHGWGKRSTTYDSTPRIAAFLGRWLAAPGAVPPDSVPPDSVPPGSVPLVEE
jgi:dipeptidyl aminopeptidase/acylaminoacyl peptidase